jgi:hypothetical protein
MRHWWLVILVLICTLSNAQIKVDVKEYKNRGETKLVINKNLLKINWPAGNKQSGELVIDMETNKPLFRSISLIKDNISKQIAKELDPAFVLTVGKRDLISQNGWNIFFDKTNKKPNTSYAISLTKKGVLVKTIGSRTILIISELNTPTFSGNLELTLYNGSPLFNVAAVVSTEIDSTAILYDAGLVTVQPNWKKIAWADTDNQMQSIDADLSQSSKAQAVKYRTIIGSNMAGSLAVFPAPHQYFYPLDEAYNLDFTWYGTNYKSLLPTFGIGIRQDPMGDKRWVPWVNAPPKTNQRLNFFCMLNTDSPTVLLEEVKKFTHNDKYPELAGYKTMSSHFHNEHTMKTVLAGKPVPETPNFVKVFKNSGVNIVHLAEFHGPGHPKGPDDQRLIELKTLFGECSRLSDSNFLLLPGEEPNNFFGGHWLDFFPKPVYWIMSRKPDMPFLSEDPIYGKVYRIGDKHDMLRLLEVENGLAWTAHARTKGSTGFPDKYKEEAFFKSDHFFGAAWKNIPADLSLPRLSPRVLDLMDDMANWGLKKHVIAEADIFSMEPENETYAHLNVNYLQMDNLPNFKDGWQPILDVMKQGKFFVSTGEIMLPSFSINGKGAGETLKLPNNGKATISISINWTFPLTFAEIISGDGKQVYRKRIDMTSSKAFGQKQLKIPINLKNRTWVRVEVWDAAVNGAFTQQVWLD